MRAGLEDMVAGPSNICYIDGERGILAYRGYNIDELAAHSTFEETAHLLWFGRLPGSAELEQTSRLMAESRDLPAELLDWIRRFPRSASPMESLRTAISALSMFDPESDDMAPEASTRKAIRLTGQVGTIVAAIDRCRRGLELVPPRSNLSQAACFSYMLTGEVPNDTIERTFDLAMVLHADNELNPSTFAARVTAATLSDMYSSIASGIGTLKGRLHGGANAEVMRMLLEIREPSRADSYIRDRLRKKQRIPGFGHRVYRVEDPRVKHLRRMSREVGQRVGQPEWFEISSRIEQAVKSGKGLYANVDFYSASAYYVIGLPIDLFTPFFAVSRMAGWTAHVLEQYSNNRLIRPRAEYTGPPPDLRWRPIDQRQL